MGAPATNWDTAFEAAPAGTDALADGDNAVRNERGAIRERAEREHIWGVSETQSQHGWHRAGSARAFFQAAAPTNKLDPSGTALDTDDEGRLFWDSDDELLLVWDGTAWVGILKELARFSIQGTLAVGTDIIPPIVFPRACTITKVTARVGTAPTGASILIDINKNGASGESIFDGSTRITIAAAAYADSETTFHATYGVLAADEYLTVDVDQVGSTVAGANLSVTIEVAVG